eukprot:SM000278S10022  [mRNA]  locus=s278:121721:123880:- [translate_table: standard]
MAARSVPLPAGRRQPGAGIAWPPVASAPQHPLRPPTASAAAPLQLRRMAAADIPPELASRVTVLTGASEHAPLVYLLGTAHESCGEVRQLIRLVQPQVVFVELCADRIAMLLPAEQLQVPTLAEMLEVWRKKQANAFAVVYSWLLAKVRTIRCVVGTGRLRCCYTSANCVPQTHGECIGQIAERMEIHPGQEFQVAYEEALACGAVVKLGDRPVKITLRRTWGRMGLWHKIKLIGSLFFQALFLPSVDDLVQLTEEMKDTDILTGAIQDLGKQFPTLLDTLVRERDLYMAAQLRGVAQRAHVVVAVVGRGHQAGIAANWENEDIDVEELLRMPMVPSKSSTSAYKSRWLLAAALGTTVAIVAIRLSTRPHS